MVKVVKYLIEQGAPLDALNEGKESAFDLALEYNATTILQVLSDSIKISERPQILHSFVPKFFDDRYKTVMMELLSKEDSSVLTPDKVNVLDKTGFTPLLACVKHFVSEYESIKDKIKQQLAYQEYLHKE